MDKISFKVNLMDRDFTVACREDEQEQLIAAAHYLDDMMRSIQQSGKVIGHERCAIMAALNISNELLSGGDSPAPRVIQAPRSNIDEDALNEQLESLTAKVEDALAD